MSGEWIKAKQQAKLQPKKKAPVMRRRTEQPTPVTPPSNRPAAINPDAPADEPYRPPSRRLNSNNSHRKRFNYNQADFKKSQPRSTKSPEPTYEESFPVLVSESSPPVTKPKTELVAEPEMKTVKPKPKSEIINNWGSLTERLKSGDINSKGKKKKRQLLGAVGSVVDESFQSFEATIDYNQLIPVITSKDPRWWFERQPPRSPSPDLYDEFFNSWHYRHNVDFSCDRPIDNWSNEENDDNYDWGPDEPETDEWTTA